MKQRDEIIMITGANSGIGKAGAIGCARTGANVVMVCRDRARGADAREDIIRLSGNPRVELMLADLSSPDSIRRLVAAFSRRFSRLDVLVNNAGVILYDRITNAEGIEMTFATNHMGAFRMTTRLIDVLKKSAPSRIINVSSEAHRFSGLVPLITNIRRLDLAKAHNDTLKHDVIDRLDFQSKRHFSGFTAYGKSKLANILFTAELARRLEGSGVTVNVLHPGIVRTRFGQGGRKSFAGLLFETVAAPFSLSPEQGADTLVYLATSDDVARTSGEYFIKRKPGTPSRLARNPLLARWLWEESERLDESGDTV